MADDTDPEAALRRTAERRVAAKAGFRAHLMVFVLVNAGLALVNLTTSPGYLWFGWPMFGWGLGLIAHGLSVYAADNPNAREAAIRREMERIRGG